MRALPKPTKLTVRYLRSVTFQLAVFLFVAALFLWAPDWLDFTAGKPLTVPLVLLWLAVACSMLAQLNPKSALTAGCMKQYPNRFDPVANYSRQSLKEAVRQQNRGAVKVAAVWLAGNLVFGILYWRRTIGVAELVLLCALYYLCDLICVLFFCPFQTFLMGNRCCVNCRIFAWGSWMMATPHGLYSPLVLLEPGGIGAGGAGGVGGAVSPLPGAVLVRLQQAAPVRPLPGTAVPV